MNIFADKMLLLQAVLHTLIGLLTPVAAVLFKEGNITGRSIAIMCVTGLVGAASGLLAFLSTTYAASKYVLVDKSNDGQTFTVTHEPASKM